VAAPEGFTAAPLRFPTPELIASPPLASYGYERETHLLGAVHVPRTARVGSRATLAGTVTWVACKVECIAGDVDLALTLPVAAAPEADTAAARAFAAEDARVPVRRADWAFRAAVDSDAIVLRVRPPAGSRIAATATPRASASSSTRPASSTTPRRPRCAWTATRWSSGSCARRTPAGPRRG
jgi:DsbC/DsbD-like thiol-disulfide interchange protein